MSSTEEIFEMYHHLQEPPFNMLLLDCILVILSGMILYHQSKDRSFVARRKRGTYCSDQISNSQQTGTILLEDTENEKSKKPSKSTAATTIMRYESSNEEITVMPSVGPKESCGAHSDISDMSYVSLNTCSVEEMKGRVSEQQIPNIQKDKDCCNQNKKSTSVVSSHTDLEKRTNNSLASQSVLPSFDNNDSTQTVIARITTRDEVNGVTNDKHKNEDNSQIKDTNDTGASCTKRIDLTKPVTYVVDGIYCSVMQEAGGDKEADAKVICSLVRQESGTDATDEREKNKIFQNWEGVSDGIVPDVCIGNSSKGNRSAGISFECNTQVSEEEYLDFGECIAAQGVQDAESIQVSVLSAFPSESSENYLDSTHVPHSKTIDNTKESLGSVSSANQYEDCPIEATAARSCCSSDIGFSAVLVELRARLKDKESEGSLYSRFNDKDYDYEELLRYDSSEEEIIP